jgi:hypothetical protein
MRTGVNVNLGGAGGQLGAGPAAAGGDFAKSGDAFLETIPPEYRNTVKKVANYEEDLTKITSQRGGKGLSERQKVAQWVAQYDPSFDMSQYGARQKLRSDFTSGVAAKNLVALNTAERHIQTLEGLGAKLPQHDWQAANAVEGWFKTKAGAPEVVSYEGASTKVADEVNRAFIGAGSQAQEGIRRELASLNSANSPAQRAQTIATIREMLAGRREELKGQYERGMGKPLDLGPGITSGPTNTPQTVGKYKIISVQ